MSNVAAPLKAALFAVLVAAGAGVGVVVITGDTTGTENAYLRMIAADDTTSPAVKAGMVMAAYYESSFRVRLTPYVDRVGKGQPLTVCNGITDAGLPRAFPRIDPAKVYTLDECYAIERLLFVGYDKRMSSYVPSYRAQTIWQQAAQLDFVHHFGWGAFAASTMRAKANAGDAAGACAEHAKWKWTTLPSGAKTVLAGLETRAKSNAEICGWPAPPQAAVIFLDGLEVLA